MYSAAILTISDSTTRGERVDTGGDTVQALLEAAGIQVTVRGVVPDEQSIIADTLRQWCHEGLFHCIVTTGGTGVGPRDVTPEATLDVVERVLPGIGEAMRQEGLKKTPYAMTSRQVAGVCQRTLIINLPGNVNAVREGLSVVIPVIPHIADLLAGHTAHSEA